MNDGTKVVKSKDVKFEEVIETTMRHGNRNLIKFDLSDTNIFVDELQASHDVNNEDIGDNGIDSGNITPEQEQEVNNTGESEEILAVKVSVENELAGNHEHVKDTR